MAESALVPGAGKDASSCWLPRVLAARRAGWRAACVSTGRRTSAVTMHAVVLGMMLHFRHSQRRQTFRMYRMSPRCLGMKCPTLHVPKSPRVTRTQILKERGFAEVTRSPMRVAEPAAVQPNIAALDVV